MRALWFFVPYLKSHIKVFWVAVVCGLVYGLMSGFGIPVIFEMVFKKIFETSTTTYSMGALIGIALLVPFTFVIRGIFGFLNTYYMNRCGLLVLKSLRQAIFDKIQHLQVTFFDQHSQGDMLSRLVNDPASIQTALLELASEGFRQPIQMLAAVGGLSYLSWKHHNSVFLLIFLATTPLCLLPVRLIRRQLKYRSRQAQDAAGMLNQQAHENLGALLDVRTYNLEAAQKERFGIGIDTYNTAELKAIKYQRIQQPIMEIIAAILIGAVFVYAYQTGIPFSVFSAMGLGLYFAIDPLKKIANMLGNVHRAHGAIERIQEILTAPISLTDPAHPQHFESIGGSIAFQNVTFQYKDAAILKGIQVHIPAKSHCALVGPSGAGKTTFVKLIARLYDVNSGSITIDGIDIRSVRLKDLRAQIAFVSQHPALFNATILSNIQIGNPSASIEAIHEAAHKAYAHEFIEQLEHGYNTVIGDDGNRLSGGQRQRIALARAFLKNAPILMLDEATSALDAHSEQLIQKALEALTCNKTVLTIAHRLSTIQKADKILVVDAGQIIAQGTHTMLLESNDLYRSFVANQTL